MPAFEDYFMDAVITAQKIKLRPDQGELFPEAVQNVFQLLGAAMPNPERDAYREADKFWAAERAKLEAEYKRIDEDAKAYDEEDRDWKPAVRKARKLWESSNLFLGFLINLGHLYNLFPRMGRLERTPTKPSYGGIASE